MSNSELTQTNDGSGGGSGGVGNIWTIQILNKFELHLCVLCARYVIRHVEKFSSLGDCLSSQRSNRNKQIPVNMVKQS